MKRFVLGVDLDNTLADFTDGFRHLFAKYRQLDPKALAKPQDYYYEDWGASKELLRRLCEEALPGGFFENLRPISADAARSLHLLAAAGITIRIMTARPGPQKISQSLRWLAKHDIPYAEFLSLDNKADTVCDLVIDDAPRQIKSLIAAGRKTIIFSHPYNRDIVDKNIIARTDNWDEIVAIVKAQANTESGGEGGIRTHAPSFPDLTI